MKKLAAILMLATALVAPSAAWARDVTIQAQMARFSGNAAYMAVYLTDASGAYQSTLWVSGHKTRYYGTLRGWVQGVKQAGSANCSDHRRKSSANWPKWRASRALVGHPLQGLLEQAQRAGQRQKLLGPRRARHRPQPSPLPTR